MDYLVDSHWVEVECEDVCEYAPRGYKWPCIDCDYIHFSKAKPIRCCNCAWKDECNGGFEFPCSRAWLDPFVQNSNLLNET